ncbi:hypothetical protein CEUSTIGMA_g10569.t1 [Chlamydomonas eustigma]|uniref:Uncharacterized protein n=1 Tax=Chlamydomonas eustigma TaxID=1157962 RepID=A0A250XJC9_9CHLO|nr:hypothetical protein CEUSTIGMA_g10569.t1 [Chlamydomonas eustigma]|eukprot:GAX83143.1 hypothetical protein CEUSTIGMA_g10569.t1 [Chlamydomonas eustigma]
MLGLESTGPSGKGVDQLFTPEINWVPADYTTNPYDCMKYDTLHVNAISNWLMGITWDNKPFTTPAIMGGNFQFYNATISGGYEADGKTPNQVLKDALNFIDDSFAQFYEAALKGGIADRTAFILTAKHGQSPMKPSQYKGIADTVVPAALEAAGIKAAKAAQVLMANASSLSIAEVLYGSQLQTGGYAGVSPTDPHAPDLITRVDVGVIYVGNPAHRTKSAEHGGINLHDRHVALMLSIPGKGYLTRHFQEVKTRQVAPTVLQMLGLPYDSLTACALEGCTPLPMMSHLLG